MVCERVAYGVKTASAAEYVNIVSTKRKMTATAGEFLSVRSSGRDGTRTRGRSAGGHARCGRECNETDERAKLLEA